MKIFKSIAVIIMLMTLTSQVSIANPKDPNSDLRKTVYRLLENPKLDVTLDENVRISFFVTTDDKIVILKTDARTPELDDYIKSRMNYQQIKIEDLDVNRIFHMKVHFILQERLL